MEPVITVGTRVIVRIPEPDPYFRQYERRGVVVERDRDESRISYRVLYDEPWTHNDSRDAVMTDAVLPEHWLVPETVVIEEDSIAVAT